MRRDYRKSACKMKKFSTGGVAKAVEDAEEKLKNDPELRGRVNDLKQKKASTQVSNEKKRKEEAESRGAKKSGTSVFDRKAQLDKMEKAQGKKCGGKVKHK